MVQIHSPRPFFICGHLEDRFEKPSVSGIRPNQRQASSFPPEQTTRLWKAEPFLANVIWILQTSHLTACKTWASFRNPIASVTESSEKRSWPG
jgi:hypothetical protein